MQEELYQEFQIIIDDSMIAFKYGEDNYDELMRREVAHILYGPPVYGTGAAFPSRRLLNDSDRVLKSKSRRKTYCAYYFDENWDLLYSRHFEHGDLDCTLLHYWIDGVNYARFFFRDSADFYKTEIFSVKYKGNVPVRCALARPTRVYVEYYTDHPDDDTHTLKDFIWYDYYPTREFSREGIPITKDAPFGAPNSPVECGNGTIKLFLGEDRKQLAEAANCWLIV